MTHALDSVELNTLPPRVVVGCQLCRLYCPLTSDPGVFIRSHEPHTNLVLVELPAGEYPFVEGKVAIVAELIARRHDPRR